MNQLTRRLLSGASFAALALGSPEAALAVTCAPDPIAPGKTVQTNTAGFSCTGNVQDLGAKVTGTAPAGNITFTGNNSAFFTVTANSVTFGPAKATATGALLALGAKSHAGIAVNNNSSIFVGAVALGSTSATANALGISEVAIGKTADVAFNNAGSVTVVASAVAANFLGPAAGAIAVATGIKQRAGSTVAPASTALVNLNNGGLINVAAKASAFAASGPSDLASALASAAGIAQTAVGKSAAAHLVNSGDIEVAAAAFAATSFAGLGFGTAIADAYVPAGVTQNAFGTGGPDSLASVSYVNNGTLHVAATATALGGWFAFASASAVGVAQFPTGAQTVAAKLVNATSAHISAVAHAGASAFSFATAHASALAIQQAAWGNIGKSSLAEASLLNEGSIIASAGATAVAAGFAKAGASAIGVAQSVWNAATRENLLVNATGAKISVIAHAKAVASGFVATTLFGGTSFATALATASAIGIAQSQTAPGTPAVSANYKVVNHGVIHASAGAFASALGSALAAAHAVGVSQSATDAQTALVALTNDGVISAKAAATAKGPALSGVFAGASAIAKGVVQNVANATFASASVFNSGTIAASAKAFAEDWIAATAHAAAIGVSQIAAANHLPPSLAVAFLSNKGIIEATAIATAKGGVFASAIATAIGVLASARSATVAIVSANNAGTVSAHAHASAHGAIAGAFATAVGIAQTATVWAGVSSAVIANLTNSGFVVASASAQAHGGDDLARALAVGVGQVVSAFTGAFLASNHLLNATGASIHVAAHALATGGILAGSTSGAPVSAVALGVVQSAKAVIFPALSEVDAVTNAGTIHVSASARGTGDVWANVSAFAAGILQNESFGIFNTEFVSNDGHITVLANAVAKTTADGFGAHAQVHAFGVAQSISAATSGIGAATVLNGGNISVHAKASASAPFGPAAASVFVGGVVQTFSVVTGFAEVINDGAIDVQASAVANGALGASAIAVARGIAIFGSDFVQSLDVINNGSIHVEADAAGNGFAFAEASGILVRGPFVFGTIANRGKMTVTANAAGAAFGIATDIGIGIRASSFTGLISNTGSLYVKAIGNASESVGAGGIGVAATSGGGLQNPLALGTVFNSGTIYAGISFDGGNTFFRGAAINVAGAPNPMAVILDGHGNTGNAAAAKIYGNIFVSTDDTITVQNGKTCFNGVVNQPFSSANFYPLTAPFLPALYTAGGTNTVVTGAARGALTITAAGTLVLVNDPKQGAAAAYVSSYAQSGTLILELRGTDGTPGANTLGKIVAWSTNPASGFANLVGGRVEIVPYAGLYANVRTFGAVSAVHITGNWTDAANIPTHSVLLRAAATVNNSATIDTITLTRVHFDQVPGLSHNEKALALGIEHIYSTTLLTTNPAFAALIGTLFQVGSTAEFAHDLYQLSGVEHGEQALATLNSVRMLNDTVGTHLQLLGGGGGSDHVGQLIQGVSPAMGGTGIGKGNIWISGYGNWGNLSNSSSGPASRTSDQGVYAGVDFDVDVMTKVGLVVGATSGEIRFDHNANNTGAFDTNNSGKYSGWHIGIYGRYDADPWYLEGIASYGTYTNDATRHIFIDPSSAALCCTFPFGPLSSVTQGTLKSSYDSHSYSAYGEAGWHWDTGSSLDLTPFLGLSWMHASSDSFAETGLPGANLAVNDATADQFSTLLGARLTTDWQLSEHMVLSPAVRVAWEHQWEGTIWSVDESFAGAPAGGHFTVNGDGYSRDFAVVGLGASVNVSSRVQAVLGYEGRWSSDQKDNAVFGRISIRW